MKAIEVTAGLTESSGSLLPGLRRDSLHVTCRLTACTPGSAPGPTLGNEYGKTLPFTLRGVCVCGCRVSFYELDVDGGGWQKQKSSGVIICPGTGSTSWHLNVNHVSFQEVHDILHHAGETHAASVKLPPYGAVRFIIIRMSSLLLLCPSLRGH